MGRVRSKTGVVTAPEPCVSKDDFAHHWPAIRQEREGDPYAEAKCTRCGKTRLFKMAWPMTLDWNALKAERKLEERKRLRRKVKAAA